MLTVTRDRANKTTTSWTHKDLPKRNARRQCLFIDDAAKASSLETTT